MISLPRRGSGSRPPDRRTSPPRVARAALVLAVAGATVGGLVLGAGVAHAQVGAEPGDVALNPASGATSLSPTWATTVACPAGFQGSAVFRIVLPSGNTQSISGFTNRVNVPFNGTLLDPISTIATVFGIPHGRASELVIVCFSGDSGTGTSAAEMYTWLTVSADGSTYTSSAVAPATPSDSQSPSAGGTGSGSPAGSGSSSSSSSVTPPPTQTATTTTPPSATATTTTLTASPNPARAGAAVTLTAHTPAADGTDPAGSVQFEAGGIAIGLPIAVSSTGVATTTATFAAAGTEALSAVFTPTNSSDASSTGTYSETVTAAATFASGIQPLVVTTPPTSGFSLTVATGMVNLAVTGSTATGALNPIRVTDTRSTRPGWSVSGQSSGFTGSGSAARRDIPGNQLGWAPTDTSLATGARLGATVIPARPGLQTAAVLASAPRGGGVGTSALGANLTLDIPASALAGPYAATLTVTAVTTCP
jgi:hypothetical protein